MSHHIVIDIFNEYKYGEVNRNSLRNYNKLNFDHFVVVTSYLLLAYKKNYRKCIFYPVTRF